MTTIANVGSIQEAQRLKLELGSAGIDSFIPDEISAGVAPHHFFNATGIRLQVAESDAEEATALLEEFRNRAD